MKRKHHNTMQCLAGVFSYHGAPIMIIIARYEERFNEERSVFHIIRLESEEDPVCPVCSGELKAKDSRRRHVIQADGSRKYYQLRRLRCRKCRGIHTELPACIQPRKHYGAEVIEGELDQRRTDCPAEESTRRRWRNAFSRAKDQIDGVLRSIWTKMFEKKYPLLSPEQPLLDRLIGAGSGWLALVNQLLIEAGHGPRTRFAF